MISIEQLKNIIDDIISDKEWVNDSESAAEYKGVVAGLQILYNHIQELKQNEMSEPEKTLELIKEGCYNTDRPSNLIIKELVEVIKLLDKNLKKKKDE